MKYSGLLRYLNSNIDRPLLIWGGPGTGKTTGVNRAGNEINRPVSTLLASILDSSDFSGYPDKKEDRMVFLPMEKFKSLTDKHILFLDELTTTHPSLQAPLLSLILEKKAGDYKLPPGIKIIAAANPPDQAAGGWELSPPMANRFIHAKWEVDIKEWCPGKYASVRAFLIKRSSLFAPELPKEWSLKNYAYPTPRSWESVGEIVSTVGFDSELITGSVGEGASTEFIRYIEELDLLDPKEVLANPELLKKCKKEDSGFASLIAALDEAYTLEDKEAPYKFSLNVATFRKDWGRYIIADAFNKNIIPSSGLIQLLDDTFGRWKEAIKNELGITN